MLNAFSAAAVVVRSVCVLCLVAQSCLTPCDPVDCSLPGSSVHGIFQARIMVCVAISSSRGSSWPRDQNWVSCVSCIAGRFFTHWAIRLTQYILKVKVKSLSCFWLFGIPWTVVYRAFLSMGFSRQEYWSGLPFPSPGDLPDTEIEPRSPSFQADSLPSEPPGKP